MTNMSTETIPTTAGAVRGERSSGGETVGVAVFRGISYAKPPVPCVSRRRNL